MIPDCLNIAFGKDKIAAENSAETKPLGDFGNSSRRLPQQRGSLVEAVDLANGMVFRLTHL